MSRFEETVRCGLAVQPTVLLRAPGSVWIEDLCRYFDRHRLESFPSAGTDEIGLDDPAPIEGHNQQEISGYLDDDHRRLRNDEHVPLPAKRKARLCYDQSIEF
ncbi:MAG: hypothetical protein OXR73_05310 [Myxococcales bacterium]|nr:hypothetical protein [Myxococcales bacterium]